MVRRFETLHLRILLEKQAELSELENDLNRVDDEERVQQHLSSCRKDKSQQRRGLVREIKSKLRDYGTFPNIGHFSQSAVLTAMFRPVDT